MASGFQVAEVRAVVGTKTQFSQPSGVEDASSVVTVTPVWDFASSTNDEYVVLFCRLSEDYRGGGVVVHHMWLSTVTTGSVRLVGSWRSMDSGDSATASFTYSTNEQGVVTAAPGTAGNWVYSTITFTHGAQMDNVAAGETFLYRLHRDQDHASDDMAADCRVALWATHFLEV